MFANFIDINHDSYYVKQEVFTWCKFRAVVFALR